MGKLEEITNNEVRHNSRIKNFLRGLVLTAGLALGTIFNTNAQSYNINVKTTELRQGTTAGAIMNNVNVTLIDTVNNVQYMGKTDSNGELVMSNVKAGNYKAIVSDFDNSDKHIGFVKKNYTVDGNKTINESLIKKELGVSNLWTYTFDPTFFKQTDWDVATYGNILYLDHIEPIATEWINATPTDSTRLYEVFNRINTNLGFEVFKIVTPTEAPSDKYTMYVNASTNTSAVGTDENNVLVGAYSKITSTDPLKKAYHEAWYVLGGMPGLDYDRTTILNGQLQTMPDLPQPCDYANALVAISQGLAVLNGEQNTFTLNEMRDYFTQSTTTAQFISPNANPSRNVEFKFTTGEIEKYNLKILSGTTTVFNKSITTTNDTIIALTPGNYTAQVSATNSAGTGGITSTTFTIPNSNPTTFTFPNLTTGQTMIYTNGKFVIESTTPTDADGDVLTKKVHVVGPSLDTIISSAANVNTLYLDASLFQPHSAYTITGEVTDGMATTQASNSPIVNSPNNLPVIPITDIPANGATVTETNYQNGKLIIKYTTTAKDADNDNVTTTSTVKGTNVNKTFVTTTGGQITQTIDSLLFQPGETYTTTISATDGIGTVNGASTTFKIPQITVGNTSIISPINGSTEVTLPINIECTPATNAKNYQFRIFNEDYSIKLDTTLTGTKFTYAKLNGNRTYIITVRGINGTILGAFSSTNTTKIYDHAPVIIAGTPNSATEVNPTLPVTFSYNITDADNDELTNNLRIKSSKQDTTIYTIGNLIYTLNPESKFLKEKTTYTYELSSSDGTKTGTATGTFNTIQTGIDNVITDEDFKVYPNPVIDNTTIQYTITKKTNITLNMYNLKGERVREYKINNVIPNTYETNISTEGLSDGIYIIELKAGTEKNTEKIIKQH
jgi:hypothetical protein